METLATLAEQARRRMALRARYASRIAAEYAASREALLRATAEAVTEYRAEQARKAEAAQSLSTARAEQAQSIRRNVQALRLRHRAGQARRAHVTKAVHVPLSREANGQSSDLNAISTWSVQRASRRLTASQRDLVRFMVSSEQRYRLASEIEALGDPAEIVREGTERSDRYGRIEAREARVNVRGAYGKRGIRGTASAVTQRDNHVPAEALRPLMLSVGHATILEGTPTAEQALIITEALRRDPSLSTVRVRQGAPYPIIGQVIEAVTYAVPSQALPLGHVVPVALYRTQAEQLAEAAREAAREAKAARIARERSLRLSVIEARLVRDLDSQKGMLSLTDALALADGTA